MDLRRPTGKKRLRIPESSNLPDFGSLENSWIFKYSNFCNYQVLGISNPRILLSGSSDRRIPGSRASELFLDWRGSSDPAREPKGCGHQDQELDRSNRTDQIREDSWILSAFANGGRSVRLIDFVSNLEWTSTVVWYPRQESDGGHLILEFLALRSTRPVPLYLNGEQI